MKRKKKGSWLVVVFLIIVVCAICGLFGFFLQKEKPFDVQIGKVERRDITEVVTANGKIHPVTYVKISSEVSGEIINLPVKEGQVVKKGELLFSIKPDTYIASSNSAVASLQSAVGSQNIARSSLERWEAEWQRTEKLYKSELLSKSTYEQVRDSYYTAMATYTNSMHQVSMCQAALDKAAEDLSKCMIYSPLNGTVTKLNCEPGERVVGTGMFDGTEVLTVSDLDVMEARVDVGEMDINLIALGQKCWLEVDAFRNKKFGGKVTQIANSATGGIASNNSTEATKFEIRILIDEKEAFRPGMSVTAEVETNYRTNVLSVPIQSVTTRSRFTEGDVVDGKVVKEKKAEFVGRKKTRESAMEEVVFAVSGDRVERRKVSRGICDDDYVEITDGLIEGETIVTGGYKVIAKDLMDESRICVVEEQ